MRACDPGAVGDRRTDEITVGIHRRPSVTRTRFDVAEDDCIGCGLCEERAPANLRIPPGGSAATVVKQPADDDETEACRAAADYCPMGALHALEPEGAARPSPRTEKR